MHTQQVNHPLSLSSLSSLRDHAVEYVAEDIMGGRRRKEGCYRGGRDLDPSSYGEKGRKSIDLEKRDTKASRLGWIRLCEKRFSRSARDRSRSTERERERESFQSSINDAYVVISMQGELG